MNQRGFATLEVILMVMVIGILASIAVPRFTSVTAAANTAKIQADLSTIDTAIAIAVMDGEDVTETDVNSATVLQDYLQDYDKIKPPTGKCYMGSDEAKAVPGTSYQITKSENETEYRATLNGKTAGEFTKNASTSTGDT